MKTTKHILIAVIGVIAAVSTACEEDNALHPWGENTLVGDLGAVTVLTTEGTPGGAVITYRLPESKDLLYVKALYMVGESTPMEVRTSRYDHSVTLQGFGDTQPREVTLLCVDKMENEGPAVTTSVTPLTPPITSVYNSLNIGTTFGGIYIDYINADKGNIAIHVQTLDEENNPYEPTVHYTSSDRGRIFVRGFKAEARTFDIYITDRWGNRSQTLSESHTPYPESLLDKSKFAEFKLDNDIACNAWGGSLSYAWNDDFTPPLFVHSPGGDTFPMSFTFDMGQTAKLSRYKFYHLFREDYAYQRGNLKRWEVWGRTDTPPTDGTWEGWTKLLDCESFKPSGLPVGEISGDDWEYLQQGEDFEFPPTAPEVRYIRFKVLETWGGDDFIHFQEFTFWGNPAEEIRTGETDETH